jgi:hypothetical protein
MEVLTVLVGELLMVIFPSNTGPGRVAMNFTVSVKSSVTA